MRSRTLLISSMVVILILLIPLTAAAQQRLKLSSTTSTDNTGLLQYILEPFEKKFGYNVDVIAVGTGKALKLAENGDVDVTLVHAPSREVKFIEDGFGVNRRVVMANYFMIAGPTNDPAGVKGAKDAMEAFQKIAKAKAFFISRGDDSGTNIKELSIWQKALGEKPKDSWYIESGSGMGATLNMAEEKQGYALTDRGTYLKYYDKLTIRGVFEKQSGLLYNPYGIMAVNPALHPNVNYLGAMQLIYWFTSPEGQKMIAEFKDKTGQLIFIPLAVPAK
jgi:tungstate transport system substrate-binding protein